MSSNDEPTPPPFPPLSAGDGAEELIIELAPGGVVRNANRPPWAGAWAPADGDRLDDRLVLEGGPLDAALDRCRRHHRTETVIGHLVCGDEEIPVAGGLIPLPESDGPRGWLLALRPGPDLPTRLLETSLSALVQAVEQTNLGVTLTDREGRIAYSNRAEAEMHGYSPRELLGRNARELGAPGAAAPPEEPASPWVRLRVNRRRDGSRFPVRLVSNQIRDWDGRVLGRLTISEDVSQRVRLTTMKEEFVRVVSHELRTPLTSIVTALTLLRGDRAGKVSRREALAIAERNAEHLLALVRDLFDLQKAISGGLEIHLAPVPVEPVLHTAAERAGTPQPGRPGVRRERIVVDLEPDGHREARVLADRGRLLQVLDHLVWNGLKFSPASEPVRLGVLPEGGRTTLTVRDRGPGVPEELRRRLFEPFSQADASTTRSGSGAGLGLALAKALVEAMDGELEISRPAAGDGPGTTILVHLPTA